MKHLILPLFAAAAFAVAADRAEASLVEFASFNGNVALSTDGFGSTSNSGVISAEAPSGSTVIAAYLYTAKFSGFASPLTVTLDGTAVTYNGGTQNPTNGLSSYRADVTALVAAKINGGAGGIYDFLINEGGEGGVIDGSALVVVYSNPALPDASVGILDGFSAVGGDNTAINFAEPLDPSDPGFFAEMRLGISFSCCGQESIVNVNGSLLTSHAGNNDDGVGGIANGQLITVGGFDDAFSPINPTYDQDHERYDLTSFITGGDTSIAIDTRNPSGDDNIFLAAFYVSGEAGFNEPPPSSGIPLPAGAVLLLSGLAGLGFMRRRRH